MGGGSLVLEAVLKRAVGGVEATGEGSSGEEGGEEQLAR